MSVSEAQHIAHLNMIQGVISRMASNSFALKTLAITITAGFVALIGAAKEPNVFYLIAAALPIAVFWWLDAKYLQFERMYRALFEEVAANSQELTTQFDMNASRFKDQTPRVLRIALSWSVNTIYLSLLVALAALGWGMFCE
jgi:hypothetical protein